MLKKNEIISMLKVMKPTYEKEGLILLGLFGSYAREEHTKFSDIDIAYKIDYNKFSTKYKDGFSKLLRIEDIKKEIQSHLETQVDLVPDTNKSILKDMIYV